MAFCLSIHGLDHLVKYSFESHLQVHGENSREALLNHFVEIAVQNSSLTKQRSHHLRNLLQISL